MLSFLPKQLAMLVRLKLTDTRFPKVLHQSYQTSLRGNNLRISPFRYVQSKANSEGNSKSFNYTPGASPEAFMNSGKQPKKPLYQQMAGERGQFGK